MPQSFVERELKFDVEPGFVVPDIAGLLPAGGRTETTTEQLRSDYFDTADHALLRAHMTLRHRTGSADAGWQLKIPHAAFREEIRFDLGSDSVPEELGQLLLGVGRGQPLTQIASLSTERSVTRLLDAEGRVLAEIDDDTVRASAAGEAATASSWREVEVELGNDELELLYALGKRLRTAGARPSASTSKLARALPAADPGGRKSGGKLRAGDVVAAYIAEQQHMILAGDLALRRGDDSVIHKTRVATRRLRSTLRVFTPLFDIDRSAALDGELRWFAGLLGQVRDRQVLEKRLHSMLDALDEGLLLGPVRARVASELRREKAEHWDALQQQLTTQRYLTLLADIECWVMRAPQTGKARQGTTVITALLQDAEHKVAKRLRKANAADDLHLLHDARKAAKRARYAAEAAEPVIGKKAATKDAKRYQTLQDLLGEHQDSIVSAELLRRLGGKAGTTKGENGFAFGILYEREQQNARNARDEARRTAAKY